jgi:transposase
MKALSIEQTQVTREKLLALAKQIPGAWIGIKIAALLLILEGQRPGWISALFGLSRMSLVNWIHGVNQEGVQALIPDPQPGRPTQLTPTVRKRLERDLEKPPREFGIQRSSWDGPTLVVHLRKRFGVNVKVRQAQYWLHSLDYSLKRAGYVYLQARAKDARHFRQELKKTLPPSD